VEKGKSRASAKLIYRYLNPFKPTSYAFIVYDKDIRTRGQGYV